MCRPVNGHAELFAAPGQRPLAGVINVQERAASQHLLAHNSDLPLDLALVLRLARLGRIDQKVMVFGAVRIRAVGGGIVDVRTENAGREVVQDHDLRNTLEEFERPTVAVDPCFGVLLKYKPHESMPGMGQHHDERPRLAHAPPLRVVKLADIPEIDLRLQSRGRLHPNGGSRA